MCAAIPILRVCSNGNGRSVELAEDSSADMAKGKGLSWRGGGQAKVGSPAKVGEGTVGLRHLVRVLLLFNNRSSVVVGINQLAG